jgi:DNA-binding response OmpR family regulator
VASLHVLIVEDEPLIAMAMEMLVQDEDGGVALGPHGAVAPALGEVEQAGRIDVAMLDCNLGREASWPVADALAARGVPFAFTSGKGASEIPARFQGRPVFPKPVDDEKLKRFIRQFSQA